MINGFGEFEVHTHPAIREGRVYLLSPDHPLATAVRHHELIDERAARQDWDRLRAGESWRDTITRQLRLEAEGMVDSRVAVIVADESRNSCDINGE